MKSLFDSNNFSSYKTFEFLIKLQPNKFSKTSYLKLDLRWVRKVNMETRDSLHLLKSKL